MKLRSRLKMDVLVALIALVMAWPLQAEPLSGAALLNALQQGGNAIVMRHASAPRSTPDQASAAEGNTALERQLDDAGKNAAMAMGKAVRELKLPVGAVLVSTTFRAQQTARLAGLGNVTIHAELGDGGQNMQPAAADQRNWLQRQVLQSATGANLFVVTQAPVINAAFAEHAAGLADGEALVLGKDGQGGVTLLARIKIEEWAGLGK